VELLEVAGRVVIGVLVAVGGGHWFVERFHRYLKTVNGGEKMHRRGGAKMHQLA
jgi:hypothetical protein